GVILNQAGSPRHADEVRSSLSLPVLGVIPRNPDIATPSRHLGLVTAAERHESAAVVARLGALIAEHVDLAAVLEIARSAPPLDATPWDPSPPPEEDPPAQQPSQGPRPVIAIAAGRAFTFHYAETTELLESAGCQVVPFDPATDPALPTG